MSPRYLLLPELLQKVDEPFRTAFQRLLTQHEDRFRLARGSSYNHQAWTGGYIDHIQEVMNSAMVLYDTLAQVRPFPFSLSDALVVLFVHDLEKPWAYEQVGTGWKRREGFKENAHAFRLTQLAAAGVMLPADLEHAVMFVEGEGSQYSNRTRGMSPLAAFCHICDVVSARLWHDYPQQKDDPWAGARRSYAEGDANPL